MNSILDRLYGYSMESRELHYLTQHQLQDYENALRSEEKLEMQLEELLTGEPLRLFKLYADHRDDEGGISNISAFRRGLVIGLKLGAFALPER